MCKIEMDKQAIQANIVALESRLHVLQGWSEMHNRFDETLPATKEALDIMRKALGEYDANDN